MYVSFWLRFNGNIPDNFIRALPYFVLLSLILKLFFLIMFNLYDISWRFVSINELVRVLKALSLSSLTLGMVLYLGRTIIPSPFPRSILFVDFIFSLILIGFLRISKRVITEGFKDTLKLKKEKKLTLVVGGGSAGEQIIREMIRNKNSIYIPLGFIDDDPAKQGIKIHGIKVLGTREDIPQIIKGNNVEEVLIALPSAPSQDIREIARIIRETNAIDKIKILPSASDLIEGKVTLSDIHSIELEDLLGRVPVRIDFNIIRDFVSGKTILITGAGGSIGSELTKTILQFKPQKLIAVDIDETDLFYLINDLKSLGRDIHPVVGDIKENTKMAFVFEKYKPEIVVHSAAYKHVPILEFYPEEAVKTNILGTKVLADLSLKHDVKKFIFISTDKAINPTSVMGATKRVGEELLNIMNHKKRTQYISVRFGNVLGSRGSVIELFKEQIRRGGPVTVTHPQMKRYFMMTSEAVLLVLEAAAIGQGGEVFVLDMGEPLKILDLAKEMIRLSGYEPDKDIPIIFTKIRAGEKLFEEILSAEEGVESTVYEKILMAKSTKKRSPEEQMEQISRLINISHQNDNGEEIIQLLSQIIPTYKPLQNELGPDIW